VRAQLNIGIKHKDPIAHVWGVMDGVVKTDFPDIKVSPEQEECRRFLIVPLLDEMYYSL